MTTSAGCGTLFSDAPAPATVFDGPIDGLSAAQLATFLAGDEAFAERFTPTTGLGPVFNQTACVSCHPDDGRGHPSTNLIRFGRGDAADARAFDYLLELGGPQLQDHAIAGYEPERLPPDVARSERSGPLAVGLGLIEAIPAAAIAAAADPADADGDGISGRANFVLPPPFLAAPADCACDGCQPASAGCKRLARFGRKATAIDLLQQTVVAYHEDMGITSELLPQDRFNPAVGPGTGDLVPDPEVAGATVNNVVFYLRTLRPPQRRDADDPRVQRGERLFTTLGCAACHTPRLRSASSPIAPLAEQDVALYSDLLLHDLGPELADHYPEGEASGSEWRTTPLWGLGIVGNVLGGQPYYLHDGRARTLEQAIEAHGGEAEAARERFRALAGAERAELLRFLRSL